MSDEVALYHWRSQGRKLFRELGVADEDYAALKEGVNDRFRKKVVKSYLSELKVYKEGEMAETPRGEHTRLARRYGVHRGTMGRILAKEHQPDLSTFCMMAAVDDASFPRGAIVTLNGYCAGFTWLEEELRRKRGDRSEPGQALAPLAPDQALCLRWTVRSPEWILYSLQRDKDQLSQEAVLIVAKIKAIFPETSIAGVEGIRETARGRLATWGVLEGMVKYECI